MTRSSCTALWVSDSPAGEHQTKKRSVAARGPGGWLTEQLEAASNWRCLRPAFRIGRHRAHQSAFVQVELLTGEYKPVFHFAPFCGLSMNMPLDSTKTSCSGCLVAPSCDEREAKNRNVAAWLSASRMWNLTGLVSVLISAIKMSLRGTVSTYYVKYL